MKLLVVLFAVLLAIAGCGDDDPGPDPVTGVGPGEEVEAPAGEEDALVGAIEGYARTVIEGDPDEVVAARSQGCAVVETESGGTDGAVDPDEVTVADVDADIDGDEATVTYRIDPAGEQVNDERWVREDGTWKWDNC